MATNDPLDPLKKRAANAVDGTAPSGDLAQAAARSTQPRSIDVAPPTNVANTLATPPQARLTQQRPADFVADAAGNIQRNTPSANWSTEPGANPTAASRLASTPAPATLPTAPSYQVTPGATNPQVVDPVAATRATVVPPAANGGANLTLAPNPVPAAATAQPLALPKPVVAVGTDGVAMTSSDLSARAQLGATPDVVRAQASHPGFVDPAAPAPVAPAPAPAPVFNRPGTGGPLADQNGTISADDFARRTAAARSAPIAPAAPVGTVSPEGVTNAATTAAETLATAPKPSLAFRAGQAASGTADVLGRAARLGATPIETVPGRLGIPKAAPGQGTAGAGIAALTAIGGAATSANRSTEDYRERLGMDKTGGVVGDTVARTAGVLSDFGANLLDIPVGLSNATGLTDIRPFGSMFNDTAGNYKPAYATDKPGGTSLRPDAKQDAQNEGWYAQQALQQQQSFEARAAAARAAGQTPPAAPAAATPAQPALTAAGTAPAAATGTTPSAATQLATPPVSAGPGAPATAGAGAGVATPAPAVPLTPAQAQDSNVAGTAVVNGRVIDAATIAALNNRNVISKEAFTNPAIGTLFSDATGGGTPTTEQAMALRQRLGQGNAASLLAQQPGGARVIPGSDSSGGGIGGRNGTQDRQATVSKLMSDISTAISSGKRRTARELVGQLSAYNQTGATDARTSAAATAPLAKPKTPIEQALELANLQEATGKAEGTTLSNAQLKLRGQLQDAVANATDGPTRLAAQRRLAAIDGREPPKRNVDKLKVNIGDDINPRNVELPYDTDANQLMIPDGYLDLIKPPAKKGAATKN